MLQGWNEPGFKHMAGTAWLFLLLIFGMPTVLLPSVSGQESTQATEPEATLPIERPIQTSEPAKDRGRVVRLLEEDGSISELTMEEYLWGVVAAEMPASFSLEALKAQTCAARTYVVRQQGGEKHEGADICSDSHCCQAYLPRGEVELRWGLNAQAYEDKIAQAVSETDGLGILYDGVPIQALFFSSAPGKTTDAVEVWGNSVDYLKSVSSPEGEEVPNYRTQVALTVEEVRQKVLSNYSGANLSSTPEQWFQDIHTGESRAVSSLRLGGITLTGNQVRTLFGLRSPAFTVALEEGSFVFSVTGYGHGVGMSQYGANKMAQEGQDFRAILMWYYTGAQVAPLWK